MLLNEVAVQVVKGTFCEIQKFETYCEENIDTVQTRTLPRK